MMRHCSWIQRKTPWHDRFLKQVGINSKQCGTVLCPITCNWTWDCAAHFWINWQSDGSRLWTSAQGAGGQRHAPQYTLQNALLDGPGDDQRHLMWALHRLVGPWSRRHPLPFVAAYTIERTLSKNVFSGGPDRLPVSWISGSVHGFFRLSLGDSYVSIQEQIYVYSRKERDQHFN